MDKVHKKIQKHKINKNNFSLFFLNKLIWKNGIKVNGDRESIDTIICLGPIKFNAFENMVETINKFSNLFNMYRIGSNPNVA